MSSSSSTSSFRGTEIACGRPIVGVEPLPRGVTFLFRGTPPPRVALQEALRIRGDRSRPATSIQQATSANNKQQARSDMTNRQADRGTESRRIPTSGPGGLSRASLPNQSVPFPWAADLNDSLPTWCLTSSSRQPPLFGLGHKAPSMSLLARPPFFFPHRAVRVCGDRSAPLLEATP